METNALNSDYIGSLDVSVRLLYLIRIENGRLPQHGLDTAHAPDYVFDLE
jgi:hypothetical protein